MNLHIEFLRRAINPGDCIGNAWHLVTRNISMYIGIGLLTLIMIGIETLRYHTPPTPTAYGFGGGQHL